MQYSTLVQAMSDVNGATFVGVDAVTQVTLTGGKKNPMQGRVTKRMTGASVMCFQNKTINGYEAMIQRRLIAEGKDPGSFTLGPRVWGERMPNLPIVQHAKDGVTRYYLEVIFLKAGTVEFLLDGEPVDRASIVGLADKPDDAESQGGLENKVIIRTFAADSITELRVNNKIYN